MIKAQKTLLNDIIKTIAYFDIFNYPLTGEQVYNFLPRNSITLEELETVLDKMVRENRLALCDGFYTLRLSDQHIAAERKENEQRALRLTKYARFVTQGLKRFPFVRGVFITGSLSKNVATKGSDIDFLIVTAERRLWICKTILTLFRKIFLMGSNKYFCTNLYVAEKHYAFSERNIFFAVELVTTKVAWNTAAFKEYVEANGWTKEFLPNLRNDIDRSFAVNERYSIMQRIMETALSVFPLTAIDAALLNFFRRHWEKKYYFLNTQKRDMLFRTSPNISSVWSKDHQSQTLDRYRAALDRLGLL